MAQTLHDQYGYSYDNLKVLLGGWGAWVDAKYPTETSATPTGGTGSSGSGAIVLTVVPNGGGAITPKP